MEYVLLDIETTGLDRTSEILEIALIHVRDGVIKSTFETLVSYKSFLFAEPYALKLNADILVNDGPSWEEARKLAADYIKTLPERLPLAGKNVSGFDRIICENNGLSLDHFSHRCIDVGSLYVIEYGYVPSLEDLLPLVGGTLEVPHRAKEDCLVCMKLIERLRNVEKS